MANIGNPLPASLQTHFALRIELAYSTVSAPIVLVVAGKIPMDLLAAEWMKIFRAKSAGKTPLQNGNYDGTLKIEEGGRRILFRT